MTYVDAQIFSDLNNGNPFKLAFMCFWWAPSWMLSYVLANKIFQTHLVLHVPQIWTLHQPSQYSGQYVRDIWMFTYTYTHVMYLTSTSVFLQLSLCTEDHKVTTVALNPVHWQLRVFIVVLTFLLATSFWSSKKFDPYFHKILA